MKDQPNFENSPSGLHVLLLADNPEDYLYLQELLLQECEGQVLLDHARTPAAALRRIDQSPYDLMLCDYHAGDGNAIQLVHGLREQGRSVPVVFLSDHIDESAMRAAVQAATCGSVPATPLQEPSLARAIRCGIAMYCKERQHQKAEEALRKLHRAVEQAEEMIVITDKHGVIEYVNPAFESTTGYSPVEAIGQTFRMLKSGEQGPGFYREMWHTLLSGNVYHGTMVNRKRNGETFVVEKNVTPVRDGDGAITHFVCCDRDITERRRLEAQLLQAQKMDAVGRLAGGVAHDFNNLLMVISAYAELTRDALPQGHALRENMGEILIAARRAADLTRQLLAFGRKQVQALQILDLNSVMGELNRTLPRLIGEDIQISFTRGESLGMVKADVVQIQQIIFNLAVNARDAMPSGGSLHIETANVRLDGSYQQTHSMVPAGDYVLLSVADSGEGISRKGMPHIFEPFFTTKPEGAGTGLGLATVYGIVKQSGGFIWVYSEPGLGTTFKVYLPRVQAGKADSPVNWSEEEISLAGTETILLVEDEPAVRASEKEFLMQCGFSVLDAANGEDALEVAAHHVGAIQLMVTDVVMPRLGGAQLAKRLTASRPEMKVLFVSGYAEGTVLQHGAIDVKVCFLQKPFSLKGLARKVRQVLEMNPLPGSSFQVGVGEHSATASPV